MGAMSYLLAQVIQELVMYPKEKQEEYAEELLELFARTTDEQWERLIENAQKRETRKSTRPLTDMTGDAPGLYESPADADKTISNQRKD